MTERFVMVRYGHFSSTEPCDEGAFVLHTAYERMRRWARAWKRRAKSLRGETDETAALYESAMTRSAALEDEADALHAEADALREDRDRLAAELQRIISATKTATPSAAMTANEIATRAIATE